MAAKSLSNSAQLMLPGTGEDQAYVMVNKNAVRGEFPIFPMDVKQLRPSSIGTLETCPKSWASQFLLGMGKDEPTEFRADNVPARPSASQIGTAAHLIIEEYSANRWGILDHEYSGDRATCSYPQTHPALLWVPKAERENLFDYVARNLDLEGEQLLAQELELKVVWQEGDPPVVMHIDQVRYRAADNAIIIVDHKTNRNGEPVEVWRKKAQPMLYAAGIRHHYPGYKIVFRIGYVNLGYYLEWECPAEDDKEIFGRLANSWSELQQTPQVARTDIESFREKFNENCGYCPVKATCQTYRKHTVEFSTSFLQHLPSNKFQRLQTLKLAEKAIAREIEELKGGIIKDLQSAGGKLTVDGVPYEITHSERRQVSFSDLWDQLTDIGQEHPELWEQIKTNELFTVKVTELDKLVKKLGSKSKERVASTIRTVASEEPSFSVVKTK